MGSDQSVCTPPSPYIERPKLLRGPPYVVSFFIIPFLFFFRTPPFF